MSQLITSREEVDRIVGMVKTAIGQTDLVRLQETVRHHGFVMGDADRNVFLMDVWGSLFHYTEKLSAETLGYLVGQLRHEGAEIPMIASRAVPEVTYGVTGYNILAKPQLIVRPGQEGSQYLRFFATWTLVCYAYDYIRQPLYRELWRRNAEEAHTESGC